MQSGKINIVVSQSSQNRQRLYANTIRLQNILKFIASNYEGSNVTLYTRGKMKFSGWAVIKSVSIAADSAAPPVSD